MLKQHCVSSFRRNRLKLLPLWTTKLATNEAQKWKTSSGIRKWYRLITPRSNAYHFELFLQRRSQDLFQKMSETLRALYSDEGKNTEWWFRYLVRTWRKLVKENNGSRGRRTFELRGFASRFRQHVTSTLWLRDTDWDTGMYISKHLFFPYKHRQVI